MNTRKSVHLTRICAAAMRELVASGGMAAPAAEFSLTDGQAPAMQASAASPGLPPGTAPDESDPDQPAPPNAPEPSPVIPDPWSPDPPVTEPPAPFLPDIGDPPAQPAQGLSDPASSQMTLTREEARAASPVGEAVAGEEDAGVGLDTVLAPLAPAAPPPESH